jgi:predicted membrane channel-forming protein YqfA (hemolysin III family)
MTLAGFLWVIVIVAVVAFLAHWIITKFFKEPVQTPAYLIVGVILLIVLLSQFFDLGPLGSIRIGR